MARDHFARDSKPRLRAFVGSKIEKAALGSTGSKCTEEKAAKVEAYMKEKAASLNREITEAFAIQRDWLQRGPYVEFKDEKTINQKSN